MKTWLSNNSEIILTNKLNSELKTIFDSFSKNSIFILVDENTEQFCLPIIQSILPKNTQLISIPSGEDHKIIQTVASIWKYFSKNGADRNSLLVNLGGGVLSDIGGFAASTFKRGMEFINIPTTLLAQVDASIGGKTGIDFNGIKNEIGVFNSPQKVLIDIEFLKTLEREQFLSGFGEMLKHALIADEAYLKELKAFKIDTPARIDYKKLSNLIEKSITIKHNIVESDPKEKNERKSLNFGHTIGHAIEALTIYTNAPILHGEAVAHGIICELYLSNKYAFPLKKQIDITDFIIDTFGKYKLKQDSFEKILEFLKHDKKNINGSTNFTLLKDIGKYEINKPINNEEIFESLNFYLDL